MGQYLSRNNNRDELVSGVRITKELLDQLDGKRPVRRALPGRSAPIVPEQQEAREVALAAKQDRSLAQALEHSHRVGRMLLKAEDAELSEIKKLADELLASEYNAPSRPVPCKEAAAAAQECYLAHASNPLSCAKVVEAYAQCTSQFWKPQAAAA